MKAENGLKKCSKCGELKGVDEYYNLRASSDGYTYYCKQCSDRNTREYAKANPHKVNGSKEWRKLNPDKNKAANERANHNRNSNLDRYRSYAHKYREFHKEISRSRQREWKLKNKDKMLSYNINWYYDNKSEVLYQKSSQASALSEEYVKRVIYRQSKLKSMYIPKELIEIKRTIIKTKRLCKTLKNSEVN